MQKEVFRRPASRINTEGIHVLPLHAYTQPSQSFASFAEGKEQLCIGRRVKSHKPMVLQSTPDHLHLYCHLVNQTPSCQWRGLLIRVGQKVELREIPGQEHNEKSPPHEQKTGFATCEQLLRARSGLTSLLSAHPQSVLFDMRNDSKADSAGLKLGQLQNLKKNEVGGGAAGREEIGDLASFVRQHSKVPRDPREGYFSVQEITVEDDGRPRISLVATTVTLQKRATSNPAGMAAVDGGHGFCVYGYPLTIKGELDKKGHCAPTELMLTSSMTLEHVQHAINRAAAANKAVARRSVTKAYTMSDGEQAYMQALQTTHSSQPVMCFFHVVAKVRKYVLEHTAMPMTQRRLLFLTKVRPDIWLLHQSLTEAEFKTKANAILQHWHETGICKATLHTNRRGEVVDLGSYFELQWINTLPWWYAGLSPKEPLVSTNNSLESTIKHTRKLAGGVPSGAKPLARFMLARVKAWSDDDFNPLAERPIPKDLWLRSKAFSRCFGTNKVRPFQHRGELVFACWERADGDDVGKRADMSLSDARKLADFRVKLRRGDPVSYEELMYYQSARLFGTQGGCDFCSCSSFPDNRRCLHTLGLGISTGATPVPTEADDTLISTASRGTGRPPRAGNRYSKPVADEESDEEVARTARAKDIEALEHYLLTMPMPALSDVKRSRKHPVAAAAVPRPEMLAPGVEAPERPAKRIRSKVAPNSVSMSTCQPIQGEGGESSSGLPQAGGSSPAHDTVIWSYLDQALRIPHDVLDALCAELIQSFGMGLLNETWLRDLTSRWLPFAAVCIQKRPAQDSAPVLPNVLPEFKALMFAITRCAIANQATFANVSQTDAQHLQSLKSRGFTFQPASGLHGNCLIESLSISMSAAGYIDVPKDAATRAAAWQAIRQHLVATPGLHPLTAAGHKDPLAYLEHRLHADAIVQRLHASFATQPLPSDGLSLWVHARYDDLGTSPPDRILLRAPAGHSIDDVPPQDALHLFNHTGEGTQGYHYDSLLPGPDM